MMVINAIGIICYLWLASVCWMEPELANVPGASGGAPIVWGLTALPVLGLFCILDIFWFLFACGIFLTKKRWILAPSFWLVPLCWAVAVFIDFSQHGI